jgi:hypothetical protein
LYAQRDLCSHRKSRFSISLIVRVGTPNAIRRKHPSFGALFFSTRPIHHPTAPRNKIFSPKNTKQCYPTPNSFDLDDPTRLSIPVFLFSPNHRFGFYRAKHTSCGGFVLTHTKDGNMRPREKNIRIWHWLFVFSFLLILNGCPPAPITPSEELNGDASSNVEKQENASEATPEEPSSTEPTTEPATEPAPDATIEPTDETATDATTETTTEPAPDATTEATTEPAPDATTEGTTEPAPDATTETTTEPAPDATTESFPEISPEPTPEGACIPGETRNCYSGPAGTEGVGACRAGFQACTPAAQWSACQGEVLPAATELCGNQIDDNCDGKTDAQDQTACSCNPGQTRECYTGPTGTAGVGVCKKGTQTCDASSAWGACQNEVLPGAEEICGNQLDDNCDGKTDTDDATICECKPNETRPCYTGPTGTSGKGECKAGTQTCGANGKWGTCQGDVLPTTEVCDGKDNNCDGAVDEETSSAPLCGAGQRCVTGKCSCDATSCPNGCCANDTCVTPTTNAQCATAGAACIACATGNVCDAGRCVCNATSCPNGCCDANGVCQSGTSNTSCGKNGVACVACTGGKACDPQSQVCGCGPNTCATGCCNAQGACTTSVLASCGVGGNACIACDAKKANVCDGGACKCGTNPACATGQECANGQCVCNAASCPNGCCNNGVCVTNRTTSLCGAAGATCAACATNKADNCSTGTCRCGNATACTGEASCTNGQCVCPALQVSNVFVNGTAFVQTPIDVVRGGTFSIRLNYKLTQVPGCPTCTNQIVVGIYTKGYGPDAATACIYNGGASSCPNSTNGTNTVNINTPLTPGEYEIRAVRDLQFNCTDALNNFNRASDLSSTLVIAKIRVIPSRTCQALSGYFTSIRLNSQGNEITVTPGASISVSGTYTMSHFTGCTNCPAQLVGGYTPFIGGGGGSIKIGCFHNGTLATCPNATTQTSTLTFTAPTVQGIYHLRYSIDRQLSQINCTNARYDGSVRQGTYGVLRVQLPTP